MLSRELETVDGRIIYPTFLCAEEREALKSEYDGKREFMWCRCRSDVKLFYRISTDLKIYPEHKGYEHSSSCIFSEMNANRKEKAFIANAETGETTAFLNFDPSVFNPGKVAAKDEHNEKGEGKGESKHREKADDAELNLIYFVRNLNIDTYNARAAAGKATLSSDYFASALYGRLKYVKFDGKAKMIRDFTLERDGFQFFYCTAKSVVAKKLAEDRTSCYLNIETREGKSISWYIYPNVCEKAANLFEDRYGMKIHEAQEQGYTVMAAGFRYRRQKQYSNHTYDCIGKIVFFIVNKNGIFARTLAEKDNLDTILSYVSFSCKGTDIRYFFGEDQDNFDGYFDVPKKSKAVISSEDCDFGRLPVLQRDIMEDEITKDDLSCLMGRALHG